MNNNTSVHKQSSSATESPAISFEAHTGDLLTTNWEQILSEIALITNLNQYPTNEQGTHEEGTKWHEKTIA